MTGSELAIELAECDLAVVFRRLVGAPPGLVFAVWTEPEHLRHWWGPRELTLVVCESDLRVGGTVTFQPDAGGALVTGKSVFPSLAARDLYTRGGMEFGLRESHQRLDEWLETVQNESDRSGR